MRPLGIILFALFWIGSAQAQSGPDALWTRTYGGGGNDLIYAIQQTSDGGYVIAGATTSFGAGNYDFYMVKTTAAGDTLWTRTYGGSNLDVAMSISQTANGGYLIAGYTSSFGEGANGFYVVRTNSAGSALWTRTYGGSGTNVAYTSQLTTDGGFVVAGYTSSFGAGGNDFYVVKANANGDTLWTRTYGGSGDESALSIQQTADGGYVIAGYTNSFGAGNNDFYLVKTNGTGDTLWTRTYGGSGSDQAYSVQQTTDGGYVIAGSTSFGAGSTDYYVVKTNSNGDTLWTRAYGGSAADNAYAIRQTAADGGYVITGYTTSFGAGSNDIYVVRTRSNGDTMWTRTYGGGAADYARTIQETPDGGYVIAGYSSSFGAGGNDCYLVKTGPDMACLVPGTPQVVITTAGNDARLNWNRITQSVGGCPVAVTAYLVFYAPTPQGPFYYHGYTTDTTYAHLGVVQNARGMYYNVLATTVPQVLLQRLESGEYLPAVIARLNR